MHVRINWIFIFMPRLTRNMFAFLHVRINWIFNCMPRLTGTCLHVWINWINIFIYHSCMCGLTGYLTCMSACMDQLDIYLHA